MRNWLWCRERVHERTDNRTEDKTHENARLR